jgi:hypothetical protein
MNMPRYLLHHHHDPDDCGIAFAAFKGHTSPLRHNDTVGSCLSGGHDIWWLVEAPGPDQALAQLPFFVAERSTVTEIREVRIP